MKVACVLITHLPMKAELARNSSLRDRPALIITQSSGGATVLDASLQAKGVSPGMPLQEALSRCDSAAVIEADDLYYQRVFDQIVEARGGLVCLNSAARFDKWNRAAVR